MYINEAGKLSGTTKKAIEYYCMRDLIKPCFSENGYRVFSEEDVERLRKISLLRSLRLSVEEIREILDGHDDTAFSRIVEHREHDLRKAAELNGLLKELADSRDWNAVHQKVSAAETRESVSDRLLKAFPGFYGKHLSIHFGSFLRDPVKTKEQESAYHEICQYLDGVQLKIPENLEKYLDEMDTEASLEVLSAADAAISSAVEDPESWLQTNADTIEKYLEFKSSEEYRRSPAAELEKLLNEFNHEQGYNTIFIPAMRRLSPAYETYWQKLQKADQAFTKLYRQ